MPHYDGEPIVIDEGNLDEYLGKAPFDLDRFYRRTPVGVVMGLAWTSMGGSTLYVESNRVSALNPNAEPSMTVTGARCPPAAQRLARLATACAAGRSATRGPMSQRRAARLAASVMGVVLQASWATCSRSR